MYWKDSDGLHLSYLLVSSSPWVRRRWAFSLSIRLYTASQMVHLWAPGKCTCMWCHLFRTAFVHNVHKYVPGTWVSGTKMFSDCRELPGREERTIKFSLLSQELRYRKVAFYDKGIGSSNFKLKWAIQTLFTSNESGRKQPSYTLWLNLMNIHKTLNSQIHKNRNFPARKNKLLFKV